MTVKLPVFLDRDGVINANRDDYVKTPFEWVPVPGAISSMAALHRAGHQIIVVTNQSGIGRGYYSEEAVRGIHKVMLSALGAAGVFPVPVMYCPHQPEDKCSCRKPETGMIDRARIDYDLPRGGWMVGDAHSDMELGRRSGLTTILVLSGRGVAQLEIIKTGKLTMPDYITDSLVTAADIIISSAVTP
ncbi:MAG: HAD-IIIA family hydrolase [Candidatus Sabulitectum sp.]|nr:HAD-IIIA family hydrolase [Candidatus Sabulitectum sp.]